MPASLKELDRRIRSVKNTQQITKAMKMVAAAKLNRSQGKMLAARPYSQKLAELMAQGMLVFGITGFGFDFFTLLPMRIWGRMTNQTLVAVPLFLYGGG